MHHLTAIKKTNQKQNSEKYLRNKYFWFWKKFLKYYEFKLKLIYIFFKYLLFVIQFIFFYMIVIWKHGVQNPI